MNFEPVEEVKKGYDVYSEDEQLIGTFLGKDLYRRCVDIGDGSTYGASFNGSAQDVQIPFDTLLGFNSNYEVVSIDAKFFRTDSGVSYFNSNFSITTSANTSAWYTNNNLKCHVYFGSQYNVTRNRGVMKVVMCVEYTKERIW